MNQGIQVAVLAALLVASLLRLASVVTGIGRLDPILVGDQVSGLLREQRSLTAGTVATTQQTSDAWKQLRSSGVDRIEFQSFATDAVVAIRPGPDRQPGVAGVDDNGSGIVDEKSELGATGSDDVCVVVPADQLADPASADPMLVLQRGAYVPATRDEAANSPHPIRAIVVGKSSDGQPWSFMKEWESGGVRRWE